MFDFFFPAKKIMDLLLHQRLERGRLPGLMHPAYLR
jgi:hypothetical protein